MKLRIRLGKVGPHKGMRYICTDCTRFSIFERCGFCGGKTVIDGPCR